MGLYDRNILNYLNFYKLNYDLKVFFFDDIKANPDKFVVDLYDYVGLDNTYRSEHFNRKWMPGDERAWVKLGEKPRHETYKQWANSKLPMDDYIFGLLRDFYGQTIHNIEIMFKRNLSHWLDKVRLDI